jgi:hypothetical protein
VPTCRRLPIGANSQAISMLVFATPGTDLRMRQRQRENHALHAEDFGMATFWFRLP